MSARAFLSWWVTTMANAMAASGEGYRRHSLRNTGALERNADGKLVRDCRKDKSLRPLPLAKAMRGYRKRYDSPRAR